MEWLFIFYNTLNDADLIRCVKEAMNKADCVDMTEAVENDSGYRAFSCRYFTVSWFKDEKIMQDFADELNEAYDTFIDSELYIQLMVNDVRNRLNFDDVVANTKKFVLLLADIIENDHILMSNGGEVYSTRINNKTVYYGGFLR